jgi:hypothetical protein
VADGDRFGSQGGAQGLRHGLCIAKIAHDFVL